jgi:transposase InsO family protein
VFVESQIGRKLKILKNDNGGEFTSKEFEQFIKFHGIQHKKLAPHSPQQNKIIEWMNRKIVEVACNYYITTWFESKNFGKS